MANYFPAPGYGNLLANRNALTSIATALPSICREKLRIMKNNKMNTLWMTMQVWLLEEGTTVSRSKQLACPRRKKLNWIACFLRTLTTEPQSLGRWVFIQLDSKWSRGFSPFLITGDIMGCRLATGFMLMWHDVHNRTETKTALDSNSCA